MSHYQHLLDSGVELAFGDLRDAASLRAAIAGADSVLACANIIAPRRDDTYETVEAAGYQSLIDEAARAGVRRVVFPSVPVTRVDDQVPQFRAKRRANRRSWIAGCQESHAMPDNTSCHEHNRLPNQTACTRRNRPFSPPTAPAPSSASTATRSARRRLARPRAARCRIRGLSARRCTSHYVVNVASGNAARDVHTAFVRFGTPTHDEVRAYLATGESLHSPAPSRLTAPGAWVRRRPRRPAHQRRRCLAPPPAASVRSRPQHPKERGPGGQLLAEHVLLSSVYAV